MERPLSQDSIHIPGMVVSAGAGRLGQVGQDRSGRSARAGLATHV